MQDSKMRGWTFTRRGTPANVLKLQDDLRRPVASDLRHDEILVKISHVGIFQGFATMMSILPHFNGNPWIPATEYSGTVVATGSSVTHVKPGDAVFGSPNPDTYFRDSRHNGVLVEYAILEGTAAVKKPDNISFESAAGTAGNGCTAMQFMEQTKLTTGMRVLVTGASGSLGSMTVQMARNTVGSEGRIVATCSSANEALVRNLGADEVIDYTKYPKLHEHLAKTYSSNPFDAIIDVAGSDNLLFDKSPAYLKADGVFIFGGKISATHGGGLLNVLGFIFSLQSKLAWPLFLGGTPRRGMLYRGQINQGSLQKLSRAVQAGHAQGLVDSVVEMEDALKAYERVRTGRARGKIIVHVQDP